MGLGRKRVQFAENPQNSMEKRSFLGSQLWMVHRGTLAGHRRDRLAVKQHRTPKLPGPEKLEAQ